MGTYFFDTSVIVKRYTPEQGQTLVLDLCDPKWGHNLYISQAAFVEVVSSFCRKAHEKVITVEVRDRLIDLFRQDIPTGYITIPVTTEIYSAAGNLCRTHRLRAYDAVQLACALDLREQTRASKLPDPIFLCADNNLLSIANAEGFAIDNPNNYPQAKTESNE